MSVSEVRVWCFGVDLKLFYIQDKNHLSFSHETTDPSNLLCYIAELFVIIFKGVGFQQCG